MIMPDAGAPPLLEIEITRKSHQRGAERVEVIDGLRFGLSAGTVTCLLGPSGCGKTTALRIIMGLDVRFEGRIAPPGSEIRLGVVFQDPRLLPWRTVEENVALAAPSQSAADRAALLAELGLADWRRQRPNQLSLGMARRVALARALAVDPDLLILDEAFVSLDERGADTLRAVTFGAVERRRATVLMVTHNVREALQFSDRILVLGPRPTHIVDTLDIDTPRAARSDAWLDAERNRLATSRADFLKIDDA
jgi:sulfonate transport system ATP-binding protein